jgi:hypothetical protein
MVEKSDKFLSVDKFKEKVYKNIGMLDSLEEVDSGRVFESDRKGCLGFLLVPFFSNISVYANKKAREQWKYKDLEKKADEILADAEIKKLLCEELDATIVLSIDAAYKITPVLYGIALEDEEKVPFDAMLFAIFSRRIVKQGVENYCRAK